ncbi:MAG: YbaL family putative K(+) efflux transporter [Hyphomicrobiaceae bacterium]
MQHDTPLISTVVVGLVLAFILGAGAQRLRASPIVGYLLAGVLVGPYTPGFVADQEIAKDLAELGIILLMFGVGLHFTLEDLLSVRAIAIPGAIAQILSATLLGMGLAYLMGWSVGAGLVFGLALSVASTVVLLRAMQERRLIETERGRIAVGWLVVEDFAMILALVLLPPIAGVLSTQSGASLQSAALPLLLTIAKIVTFVALMLVVGKRFIPWLLHYIAHTGSRELFRLSVLAIALGVAYGASLLFDVSFALGAFFAGVMLSESELSQRAANESLPLRDAFAVLFFVSVGMLFDPSILLREIGPVIVTLLIIVIGKSVAAFAIVRLFGHPTRTALTISASLAQIGEFSFILAGLGVSLGLMPNRARDLILAGAILSILLNPILFAALDRFLLKRQPSEEREDQAGEGPETARVAVPVTKQTNHVVLIGNGRVGSVISAALTQHGAPFVLIEEQDIAAYRAREQGTETIAGNAADPEVLAGANLAAARCLLVAIPDAFEGGQVVEQARAINPNLLIIARAHSDEEVLHLQKLGSNSVIMGEQEIAHAMLALIPG